jgi:hypothetical protein
MVLQHAPWIRSRTTRERLGLLASGVPRTVAALQRAPAPARDHPPLRAWPPDRAAHPVMAPVCRPTRGHGHGPAARPPDLISHHQGEAGAAGQRGASSGCSTAARSCPRSPAPEGQAARPGRPPGDDPCLPSRPGAWPWSSSTPPGSDLAPPGRGRGCWPAGCLERLQHCSALLLLPAITRP